MSHKLRQNANFENGGTNIQRGILQALLDILSLSLLSRVNDTSSYVGCNTSSHIILGYEENQ